MKKAELESKTYLEAMQVKKLELEVAKLEAKRKSEVEAQVTKANNQIAVSYVCMSFCLIVESKYDISTSIRSWSAGHSSGKMKKSQARGKDECK